MHKFWFNKSRETLAWAAVTREAYVERWWWLECLAGPVGPMSTRLIRDSYPPCVGGLITNTLAKNDVNDDDKRTGKNDDNDVPVLVKEAALAIKFLVVISMTMMCICVAWIQ